MSVQRYSCWAVLCDICGDGWTDPGGTPHYDTQEDAEAAARLANWVLTPEQHVCAGCLVGVACGLVGHTWGAWSAAGPFPSKRGGEWKGRVRHCTQCSAADWDPPIGQT